MILSLHPCPRIRIPGLESRLRDLPFMKRKKISEYCQSRASTSLRGRIHPKPLSTPKLFVFMELVERKKKKAKWLILSGPELCGLKVKTKYEK